MDRAKAASHRASLCGSISALGPSVSSSVKGGKGLFPRCPPTLGWVTGCGSHSWVREDGKGRAHVDLSRVGCTYNQVDNLSIIVGAG